jgi:hypothetical protein
MVIMHHQHNQVLIHQQLRVQLRQHDKHQSLKIIMKSQEKLRQKHRQEHHVKKDTNVEKRYETEA